MSLGSLRSLIFRTSDRYELVLHDRLRPEEARRFEPLTSDASHWGVLRPLGPGTYRAVDRDTALLLLTLREPGRLPAYVLAEDHDDGRSAAASIRAMVLDGILDAETEDGEPVRLVRPAAREVGETGEEATVPLQIDERSLAALRYGAALCALAPKDSRDLSIRLYLFGGEPLRRSVCERLATGRQVLEFLGLDPGGAARNSVRAGWRLGERAGKGWIFLRREEAREQTVAAGRGRCKLYVGCRFRDVPGVLQAVVASLAGSGARSMKVGSSPVDLVRTDKIVVYFDSFEALQAYAAMLSPRLAELGLTDDAAPLGVPFTAPAGGGGLLSWGVDPPEEAIPIQGTFTESWRAWVASRLAAALVSTRHLNEEADERLRTVLERVTLDGIDVTRWTPDSGLWSEP